MDSKKIQQAWCEQSLIYLGTIFWTHRCSETEFLRAAGWTAVFNTSAWTSWHVCRMDRYQQWEQKRSQNSVAHEMIWLLVFISFLFGLGLINKRTISAAQLHKKPPTGQQRSSAVAALRPLGVCAEELPPSVRIRASLRQWGHQWTWSFSWL